MIYSYEEGVDTDMRLRNVKGSRETIAANPLVICDITEKKGQWHEVFENSKPLYIEIGMGKGQFILEMARRNADKNFIGIEKYSSVLVRALEKCETFEGDNLRFIRMDAEKITEVFARHEVDGIYLNFSDPWPKDRHAKRRLTYRDYWSRYNEILKPEGEVIFKTDNRPLFDFSLEEVQAAGWELTDVTCDLHHSPAVEDNVMTEYEAKFSALGNLIHRLIARR